MRSRLLLRSEDGFALGCELDAADADEVWRLLAAKPELAGRPLAAGDVVYIADLYWELNGDGGWSAIPPGELTRQLYRTILES